MADVKTAIETFKKHGFVVNYFEDKEKAAEYIASSVKNKTVGFGGSITCSELGLSERLSKDNIVISHWHVPSKAARDMQQACEVYITSANAISETGEIVNIDGSCNRVAASIYGKEKVYFIVGTNKIEPTLERAMWRAKNIAAPKNAQRLHSKTPCAVTGVCSDCESPGRICRVTVIIDRPPVGMEMELIIIDETLGY